MFTRVASHAILTKFYSNLVNLNDIMNSINPYKGNVLVYIKSMLYRYTIK